LHLQISDYKIKFEVLITIPLKCHLYRGKVYDHSALSGPKTYPEFRPWRNILEHNSGVE